MVVLDNSIIQDFEQICSTFLKIFKLYLLDTPTFIIEPIRIKAIKMQKQIFANKDKNKTPISIEVIIPTNK